MFRFNMKYYLVMICILSALSILILSSKEVMAGNTPQMTIRNETNNIGRYTNTDEILDLDYEHKARYTVTDKQNNLVDKHNLRYDFTCLLEKSSRNIRLSRLFNRASTYMSDIREEMVLLTRHIIQTINQVEYREVHIRNQSKTVVVTAGQNRNKQEDKRILVDTVHGIMRLIIPTWLSRKWALRYPYMMNHNILTYDTIQISHAVMKHKKAIKRKQTLF